MVDYANVPKTVAAVVSSRLATLSELWTVYGLESMWQLLEISSVDIHNTNILNKAV